MPELSRERNIKMMLDYAERVMLPSLWNDVISGTKSFAIPPVIVGLMAVVSTILFGPFNPVFLLMFFLLMFLMWVATIPRLYILHRRNERGVLHCRRLLEDGLIEEAAAYIEEEMMG